jgi:hypothetical protein
LLIVDTAVREIVSHIADVSSAKADDLRARLEVAEGVRSGHPGEARGGAFAPQQIFL